MKTSTSEGKNEVHLTDRMKLNDLDFADYLAFLSHTHQQMQEKTISVVAASTSTNHQYKYQDSSTVWGGNLKNYESHHPEDTIFYQQLSTQSTSDPLTRNYQQHPIVGENKADASGGRNQEEALEVDRTHIEEIIELRHRESPHLKSSVSKEKRKTNEYITSRNGDIYEKNEQQLDRSRKEVAGQSWM
ncbi:unnamed protein product [Schistosoma margrebowiei]|uniref:Uncharacterized protein n=1 Tax=Schistosoma margrebowiei TaxID=48269 RepID=A0A183M370_9TREM|nr:unnamed protein product [Schistosoma margrebowiei]